MPYNNTTGPVRRMAVANSGTATTVQMGVWDENGDLVETNTLNSPPRLAAQIAQGRSLDSEVTSARMPGEGFGRGLVRSARPLIAKTR